MSLPYFTFRNSCFYCERSLALVDLHHEHYDRYRGLHIRCTCADLEETKPYNTGRAEQSGQWIKATIEENGKLALYAEARFKELEEMRAEQEKLRVQEERVKEHVVVYDTLSYSNNYRVNEYSGAKCTEYPERPECTECPERPECTECTECPECTEFPECTDCTEYCT